MENKLFIVLMMVLSISVVSALEIDDVNGSWVDDDEVLMNSRFLERRYSWGIGKTIPNYSIDIDLGKKEVRLSGMGLHIIDTVFKDEDSSIYLELFYVGDAERLSPLHMKINFIDSGRAYIVCYPQKGWWSRPLSPDEKWVWYRLSGPERK